jgi:ABC-2 type transport system permease protein
MFKKIYTKQNKALLSELVRTDFKLRYQGSILGYAWSLLKPLLLFLILFIVFTKFLRIGEGVPHYPVYLLLGIVLWQFFSDLTNQGLSSIVGRGDLIRKIRIPRWMIVFSSSFSAVINLGLNLLVVGIFMIVNGAEVSVFAIWLPFIILEIYIFGLGISLYLSAAFVKYRDISFIWEIVLQAGFYLTPILYPLTLITNVNFQKLLLLNPVAQAIQDARNLLVTQDTLTIAEVFGSGSARMMPLLFSFAVLVMGTLYFKKASVNFAEDL